MFQDPTLVHGISSWAVYPERTNRSPGQTLSHSERSRCGHRVHIILPVYLLQCHPCLGNVLLGVIISTSTTLDILRQLVTFFYSLYLIAVR